MEALKNFRNQISVRDAVVLGDAARKKLGEEGIAVFSNRLEMTVGIGGQEMIGMDCIHLCRHQLEFSALFRTMQHGFSSFRKNVPCKWCTGILPLGFGKPHIRGYFAFAAGIRVIIRACMASIKRVGGHVHMEWFDIVDMAAAEHFQNSIGNAASDVALG